MTLQASMVVAASVVINTLLGASALKIIRSSNVTPDYGLNYTGDYDLNFVNEGYEFESCDSDFSTHPHACDIEANARGNLSAQRPVRPFFLKFHKVGGTSLTQLLNTVTGVTTNCGRSCGHCLCSTGAKACTGHRSRNILVNYILAAQQHYSDSFLSASHPSVYSQLIPAADRRQLFKDIQGSSHPKVNGILPLSWVPNEDNHHADVLFITLLRDPVERIRAKYYFQQSPRNCKEPCPAKHMSFVDWMHLFKDDHTTCCEYVAMLGLGSITRAKKVLASLFDVVGITEEIGNVYTDVATHFGVPVHHLPENVSCRGNSDFDEDWTTEQLRLARRIVAMDSELYEFARDLNKQRRAALHPGERSA